MIEWLKKVRRMLKVRTIKIGASKRRKKLKNTNFTLISNNCWGGLCYEYLDIPFYSPTIGLYFYADDYIRFVSDLKNYIMLPLTFINVNESKHYESLIFKGENNVIIGILGDVEIIFLHYKSKEEALEKWNKRVKRINFENLIIKFNDQNECKYNDLKKFDELEVKNKIMFTSKDYKEFKCNIFMKEYHSKTCVKDDAFKFKKYINMVEYINSI